MSALVPDRLPKCSGLGKSMVLVMAIKFVLLSPRQEFNRRN